MISAHKIILNNLSSEEFGVTPHCSFGGDGGTTSSFLNRDGVYTEHYDGHRTIHRAKYNETLTPRFTLVKTNFSDFDPTENRRILSWLTASEKPGWLEVYEDDSNVLTWRVFGCITSVEQYKLGNGRVVGYEFEIESSHAYAWSRKFIYPDNRMSTEEISNNDETNDYLVVSGTKEITLTCDSDEYGKLLYPKATIKFLGKNPYFPIDVNPIEDTTYRMVPNVIYSRKQGETEHLYVSLNKPGHEGRYEVQPSSSSTSASGSTTEYKYYYFPTENLIKTAVPDGPGKYKWESVSIIGMAVKMSNRYILNGIESEKESIIAGGVLGETIILDGTNKVISGTSGSKTRIVGDDFNWEWLPLATGDNTITVTGQCEIKFEWLEPRKVGSL